MESRIAELAPVALFAFKRPDHLRRTINALNLNPEFSSSPIHVFCDGARRPEDIPLVQETRDTARSLLPAHAVIVEREHNLGLRRSIVEGVTQLTRAYGKVVVVEDDLIVAKHFLAFMNAALDRYRSEPAVMQISGHMFPVQLPSKTDAVFLPFTTTWGWATWLRAWESFQSSHVIEGTLKTDRSERRRFNLDGAYPYFRMLQQQRRGDVDSWGILWYLSVFANNGLTLYPARSMVLNAGFDGSGTNCSYDVDLNGMRVLGSEESGLSNWPGSIEIDSASYVHIKRYLRQQTNPIGKVLRKARSLTVGSN